MIKSFSEFLKGSHIHSTSDVRFLPPEILEHIWVQYVETNFTVKQIIENKLNKYYIDRVSFKPSHIHYMFKYENFELLKEVLEKKNKDECILSPNDFNNIIRVACKFWKDNNECFEFVKFLFSSRPEAKIYSCEDDLLYLAISNNQVELVIWMLKEDKRKIFFQPNYILDYLQSVSSNGSFELFLILEKYLYDYVPDLRFDNSNNLFCFQNICRSENLEFLKYFVQKYIYPGYVSDGFKPCDKDMSKTEYGLSLFQMAIRSRNMEICNYILDTFDDFYKNTEMIFTDNHEFFDDFLHCSCDVVDPCGTHDNLHNIHFLKWLHHKFPNAKFPHIWYIQAGKFADVSVIQWVGSKVDFIDEDRNYYCEKAMLEAVKRGNLDVIKFLSCETFKPNPEFVYNATWKDRFETLEWLLEHGYQLSVRCIEVACIKGHIHILKWFDDRGYIKQLDSLKNNDIYWISYLLNAAEHGNLDAIIRYIDTSPYLNNVEPNMLRLVMNAAISCNCLEAVKYLDKQSSRDYICDDTSCIAFFRLCSNLEMVKFLHSKIPSSDKYFQLMSDASVYGSIDVLKYLIDNSCFPPSHQNQKYELVDGAVRGYHIEVVEYLIYEKNFPFSSRSMTTADVRISKILNENKHLLVV